ncbi:MAG: DEAD/DEAH box helicase [Muribaculaceae bacterium]|nr:DEAD/DEAH box helicase [Muribaculaceae bacterium]
MATKTNRKNGQKKSSTINATHRPANMTLEQWQKALRRQAAAKEHFGIKEPFGEDSPFVVSSAKSGRSYRVHYFGQGSSSNRCECMDFKTSRLGTCKHIEAISLANEGIYARKVYLLPFHTYVYVDYPDGRKIKICRGQGISQEMKDHIHTLFDDKGEIRNMQFDPSDFIRKAKQIDETFEWEPDALNILIEERDKIRRKKLIEKKYCNSLFDGLLKTSLHPYQAEGVRFAFEGGRTINADEMGLGKTVQAIATAELLKREGLVGSVIIICPTSLKYQWLSEIRRFTDSSAIVVEGSVIKRRDQLNDFNYFYKICSFHAMSNSIKAEFIPHTDMIIYDELQRLKNKETQMGKQLRKLQSQYVMALSGTPLENKLDELYSVTQLVDQYVLGPYYKFNAETTLTDELGKIVGYRNLHTVAEKLKNTLIRRKKSDVKLQMPARTDTNLFVPMTKEQKAMHDEYQYQVTIIVDKWRRFKFLSEADRKRLLLFLSMMRMVCDSTFILDQKSRFDTKIDETMAIISNLLDSEEGKVVIFSQWERMLRILAEELKNQDIDFCFLHGGVPSAKRKNLIDRFRDDPDCRIFLSTDAGATGLNLQTASLLINLDLPWNPAVLEQRIARIYRLGQTNPVQIINMVARGTIEERMLTTLRFKSDLAAGILDGGEDAVFFDNNKFAKIVEVVDGVINEPETTAPEPDSSDSNPEKSNQEDISSIPIEKADDPSNSKDSSYPKAESTHKSEAGNIHNKPDSISSNDDHSDSDIISTGSLNAPSGIDFGHKAGGNASHQTPEGIRKTVAGGLEALGKIADMLRSPESTAALVDAIVKEDPETGQASLNIPVPDKSTVVNILSAFSAFLNR